MKTEPRPPLNPYLAGLLLGAVLLGSFLILGAGLGASAGIARVAAYVQGSVFSDHVHLSEYFGGWGRQPLRYYLVFMVLGTCLGGLFSAWQAGRLGWRIERGSACSRTRRLALAFGGGVLTGFASRLAQGCTSGQALSGGALLLSGSLVFLVCIFAGGYAAAWLFRRQWHV